MKRYLSRRHFIRTSLQAGAAITSPLWLTPFGQSGKIAWGATYPTPPKVVLISIDSLDPRYLYLDQAGKPGGRDGNWLMPNVRAFLDRSTWFENARCYLPSATDMNHLNAVAATSSAQTGIFGVSAQPFNWNTDGTMNLVSPNLSWARDDLGRSVDTLFAAWKRKYGSRSRTMFASGKEWVADMFDAPDSGVDMIINGEHFPSYFAPPPLWNFYDPPGDDDADTDNESSYQKFFYEKVYAKNPQLFPCDNWVVKSSLKYFRHAKPDLAVVLLAQMDDLQHGLGTAYPEDFIQDYGKDICRVNHSVYKEAVLDGVRDVDRQFGMLFKGLRTIPAYRDAIYVLYSDHGHITHRNTSTSIYDYSLHINPTDILLDNNIITEQEARMNGYFAYHATSTGALYFKADSSQERLQRAKEAKSVLESYRVYNTLSNQWECPWYILDQDDAVQGISGICEPGELYHEYLAEDNISDGPLLHDLVIFMQNGYQLPVMSGFATNLGIQLPDYKIPENLFLGGHGSVDTKNIVMAISGPDISSGNVISDPDYVENYRIADIATTICSMLGLDLQSTTIGRDRSGDLV